MTAAFKEWAIVVDALARGQQIFILRKGGIHEGRGGFKPDYREFFLFPTLFHQQRESVIPSAQTRFDQIAPSFPSLDVLRLDHWAELVEWHHIRDFDAVRRLEGQHIWREDLLKERFEWGREHAIFALALRVYRLPFAIELPMLPEYGGCKSWVQVPSSLTTRETIPVLEKDAFEARLEQLRGTLSVEV
jgi:hypothetical protein